MQYTRVNNPRRRMRSWKTSIMLSSPLQLCVHLLVEIHTSPSFDAASARSQMTFTAGNAGGESPLLFQKQRESGRPPAPLPAKLSSSARAQEGGGNSGRTAGSASQRVHKCPRVPAGAFDSPREPSSKRLGETAAGGRLKYPRGIYHFTRRLRF